MDRTKQPKVLFFDIEINPNLCYTWGLGKQWVGYENIHKERQITVICWKWAGEKQIRSLCFNLDKHDLSKRDDDADKNLLEIFRKEYEKADVAVGHNAIKFDIGTIRSRLIKHGLKDIAPVILDDTYLASLSLRFNSHKLDYLSQYLDIGRKAPHEYSLWKRVMAGDRRALRDMVKYCKQDVVLLEKVYEKLKPFIRSKLNRAVFHTDDRRCPSCGETRLIKNGYRMNASGNKKIRLKCIGCGKHCLKGTTKGYPHDAPKT